MSKTRIKQLLMENPLNTPVLLAIQGVSRKERHAAIGLGMDNDLFKNHQVSPLSPFHSILNWNLVMVLLQEQ
jgi:hypothetical protein